MADGRHFEKNVKALYLCNRLMDFEKDHITQHHVNIQAM